MMALDKHKVEVNMVWLTLKCTTYYVHTGRAEVSVSN